MKIEVKSPDGVGDIFVKGLDGYIDSELSGDSLTQLTKNYETAFGEKPDKKQLRSALHFVESFLAEVGTTSLNTRYARAATALSWMIDPDDIIKTAELLAGIRVSSFSKSLNNSNF